MNVIFKNLDLSKICDKVLSNSKVRATFKFINNNKILVKIASVCLVSLMTVSISTAAAGITVGYDVECAGKVIATVRDASVLEDAKNIAVESVNGEAAKKAVAEPVLAVTLTVAEELADANSVAESIIENSDKLTLASALKVNGETVALVETDGLDQALEDRKNAYNVEDAENEASFVEDVEIENGYFLKQEVKKLSEINDIIDDLKVKTVSTVTVDEKIAYSTKKVRTDTKSVGYYKVTTEGKNGILRKTEKIESINGVEKETTVLDDEVVSEPVTEIITIGTAPVTVSATERAKASSAGFICPIDSGKYTISAYYGDGRNHKAIDLAADRGVAIFAAAAGQVIYAGYDSDYGYNILIDHGNGMQTRYAHANALCVNKGQTVAQGDMIATVGSTGYSTGNHLHFEVIVNGARVNPAPYIGLN